MLRMARRTASTSLLDRALIRAVADAERDGGAWIEAPAPPGQVPSDDGRALVARARRLAGGLTAEAPVRRVLRSLDLLWVAAAALGLLAGVSAAWAGLSGGGDPTKPEGSQLNPLWFLQITLGIHTVFLMFALAAPLLARAGFTHPWGAAGRALASGLVRLATRGKPPAGGLATITVGLAGRRGLWLASCLGHVAGLSFVVGAILAFMVAAGFREQYRFFWKSTLLTNGQAVALVDAVAAGPRALGVPTPTREEIAAARAGVSGELTDQADPARWAWMLVGSLAVWGVGPRLLALSCTGLALWRATRWGPLPVSASYAQRALERERRVERGGETKASEEPATAAHPETPLAPDNRPVGPPVVLGYEIDAEGAWPPPGLDACTDLGMVDGAPDRRRLLEALDNSPTRPRAVIACFSRGETPAQAERDFLEALARRAGRGLAVVLTLSRALATDRASRDADRIAHRTGLWRAAASRAGVAAERVFEVDLQHVTAVTAARLGALCGAGRVTRGGLGAEAIAGALEDIEAWSEGEDHSDPSLAALLRTIEGRFDAEPRWRRAIKSVAAVGSLDEAKAVMAESARSFGRLLPDWMPRHPGWMAAAATLVTTGTLSAVALAGGPIGIAAGAWPLYAAVGAALGELGGRGLDAVRPEPLRGDAAAVAGARAAVLHALVLGLQGLGDEQIARSIDLVLEGAPQIGSAREVGALTAHVRARVRALPGVTGAGA